MHLVVWSLEHLAVCVPLPTQDAVHRAFGIRTASGLHPASSCLEDFRRLPRFPSRARPCRGRLDLRRRLPYPPCREREGRHPPMIAFRMCGPVVISGRHLKWQREMTS